MRVKGAAQLAGAAVLAFVLAAGANEQGTLYLTLAAAVGFAAAAHVPKPWAPVLGAAVAASAIAAATGADAAHGFGYGVVIGLALTLVVRLSRNGLRNIR